MNSDPPIPVERLREISKHLSYEIEMWVATRDMLADRLWEDVDGPYRVDTARNALLEAFTMHTRALMDFLYAEPRGDDVSAEHFFTPEEWHRITTAPEPDPTRYTTAPRNIRSNTNAEVLRQARRRVGKEIAHLTYKRLEPEVEGKLWPTAEIVAALSRDLFRFIDQVPHDRVHDRFKGVALSVAAPPEEHQAARVNEPGVSLSVATQALSRDRLTD